MKKVFALGLLLFVTTVSAFAQEGSRQDDSKKRLTPEERMDKVAKDLELNEKQTKEFKKINQEFMEKMKKQRESNEKDQKKAREVMETARKDRNDKIKKVMTEEQYKKFEEMEKKQRAPRNGNREGGQRPQRQRPSGEGRPTSGQGQQMPRQNVMN